MAPTCRASGTGRLFQGCQLSGGSRTEGLGRCDRGRDAHSDARVQGGGDLRQTQPPGRAASRKAFEAGEKGDGREVLDRGRDTRKEQTYQIFLHLADAC
jgi:hypothetical protein